MQDTIWVHDLNPVLIPIWGNLGIRWYGLAYLTGFVVGAMLMFFLAKRGRRTIHPDQVLDFITYIVLGTMIGGRVGYALFYSPDLLTKFTSDFPFWGLLAVHEGGMASHGGIMGIFIAAVLFARRHKLDWRHLGDLTTLGGTIGIFFGRIANFINGELFGRIMEKPTAWAVKFPQEIYLWLRLPSAAQPERLNAWRAYEGKKLADLAPAAKELGVAPEQWASWVSSYPSSGPAQSQVQSYTERIVEACHQGHRAILDALRPVLEPRHPSQLYQALLEGLLVFLVLMWIWRKPRKPGVVGGVFLSLYAVMRIIGEQFRMPDSHIGFQLFGLTRGQWLSLAQLVASLALLVWLARRNVPVISGWGPEAQVLKEQEENEAKISKKKKPAPKA